MNHSVSYQELKAKRLQNPEYAKLYLETALEDTRQDGNSDVFLLAIQDVLEAHDLLEENGENNNTQTDMNPIEQNRDPSILKKSRLGIETVDHALHSIG